MRTLALFFAIMVLFASAAQAAAQNEHTRPKALNKLIALRGSRGIKLPDDPKNIRAQYIKETAFRLGIQSGAKWRNEQIQAALEKRSFALDSIFSFRLLLINGRVLPPVIVQSETALSVEANKAVQTGTSYKIIKEAKFVSSPPSWRDYMFQTFSVQEVSPVMLPRKKTEVAIWESAILDGWEIGSKQADRIYDINIRKLTRDMRGIILFKLLAGQGFVSLPKINESRFAIQVGANQLDLDQTTFTISKDSQFQGENRWKPFQMK